jgi:hypothetical protein
VSLSLPTTVGILLDMPRSELEWIEKAAEQVVLGCTTSISALNQSATFDRAAGGVVLQACRHVRKIIEVYPDANSCGLGEPTLAHTMERHGFLWGS